jgi:two-component sensor histidine kinase
MAIIHEKLYHDRNVSQINFKDYLESLTEEIRKTYQTSGGKITVVLDMAQRTLNLNTAIPCALIVNELLSNSFKHAYRTDQTGEIRVSFEKSNADYILSVSDQGVGLPADFELENVESLGLKIVRALTEQLAGKIEIKSDKGLTYRIQFKDVF